MGRKSAPAPRHFYRNIRCVVFAEYLDRDRGSGALPIYFFVTQKLSKRIYEIEQQANEAFEKVSKELYDVAGNVLTVKKFSQEDMETEQDKVLMSQARRYNMAPNY